MHTYYCSKIIRRISREIWRDIRVLLFESIRRMDICIEKYSYIIGEKYSKDEWVRRNIHIARNAYEIRNIRKNTRERISNVRVVGYMK